MSWSLVDKSLVVQTILYFGIVASGLASVISAVLSKDGFGSLCILYGESNCYASKTDYNSSDPPLTTMITEALEPVRILISEGAISVCNFVVAINIIVCIMAALFSGLYHAHCAKKSAYQIRVGYQMWTKVLAFSSFLSLVLVMSAACMVTVGISKWCKGVMEAFEDCSLSLQRCSDTQNLKDGHDWTWVTSSSSSSFQDQSFSGHYLDLYEVTETTGWINVALWLIQVIIYIHRLFKQRYVQTSYQEPFTADFLDAFT